jgi:hypothetical protein
MMMRERSYAVPLLAQFLTDRTDASPRGKAYTANSIACQQYAGH